MMDCGCGVTINRRPVSFTIDYCPLHAAAGELLEAAQGIRDVIEGKPAHFDNIPEFLALQAAITKATAG